MTRMKSWIPLYASVLGVALIAMLGLYIAAEKGAAGPPRMFETSDQCIGCHNGLKTTAGQDVSIGSSWRASMMANSARDPYWQGAIRREVMDHPSAQEAIEGECSICHMAMARFTAHAGGQEGQVFAHLPIGTGQASMDLFAADGVSCTVCHQIQPDGLGTAESFVGGFVVDESTAYGERKIFGPYEIDDGRVKIMNSASSFVPEQQSHIEESSLCGSCHTLYTQSLDENGNVVGELPEQMVFLEWKHSSFSETSSCQSCHMRTVPGRVAISSVWADPRDGFAQHVFRGGNFFILRLLDKHRKDLGTMATSLELMKSADETIAQLKSNSAKVTLTDTAVAAGVLTTTVNIENLAGHKLPSAYPSRRVWIHLTVRDVGGNVVFESGALSKDGSIAGNANDDDASLFEPHYLQIGDPDQVQIYEAILGDPGGSVTTGLLTATQYLKDSRLLPRGFDKATADADIAVTGGASTDPDFIEGGDRILYTITTGESVGPFTISVELFYQPIGFRWAHNLEGYDEALEPGRFVGYYEAAAGNSAVVLATASADAVPPSE
jgi:hypothetical protein